MRRREQQEKLSEKAIKDAKLKELDTAEAALAAAARNPKENGPVANVKIPTTVKSGEFDRIIWSCVLLRSCVADESGCMMA